jgi:hypothetical protein
MAGLTQIIDSTCIDAISSPSNVLAAYSSLSLVGSLHTICMRCRSVTELSVRLMAPAEDLKIRSPKLTSANASEEDRWKVLYTTLFPKDPKDAVPRPCKRRYSCLFSWVAV